MKINDNVENAATNQGRRRALVFALSFLAIAFVLMTTFRFVVGSRAMNAYLFVVARNTAAVLSIIGDSSGVETPENFRGREAMVRACIDAWRRGETPPKRMEAQSNLAEPPLTSWEVWEYRAGQLQSDITAYRNARQALQPPPPREVFNRKEHAAVVQSRLAQLEALLPGCNESVRTPLAKSGLAEFVRTSRTELDALANDSTLNTETFVQRMSALAAGIEAWREEQLAFVQGRLDNLEAQQRERGPRVDFCYRDRAKAEQPASPSTDIGFSFELVPDCGALPVMAIYLAAVLAFPTAWRRRLMGVVLGLPVLYVVNVARLASLAMLGAWDHGGKWYQFAHEYAWQGVYIGCVVVTWLAWLESVVKRRSKTHADNPEEAQT